MSAIARWAEATRPRRVERPVRRENATLRRLFWLYFWLLITEGVLRKWIVPSLSTPLLLIRDPIPFAILWIGIREGKLPRSAAVYIWVALSLACFVAGMYVLPNSPQVPIYGLKCDFLHVTMIAVAPLVMEVEDIDRMIRAIIFVSVPIAVLMAWQFHSPNNAWINSGLDNTFKQIDSAQGHIRPAGPFSYIAGPAAFCALLAAVLTGSAVDHRPIKRSLLLLGSASLVVSALYSSSRGLIGGVLLVVATGLLGALAVNPRVLRRYLGIILAFGFVAVVITNSSLMQDTVEVFSTRVDSASKNEGGTQGLADRYFGDFTRVVPAVQTTPPAGFGLGAGTVGGGAMLTGDTHKFLLSEAEWPRVVAESGPILGLMFISVRVALMLWLGWQVLQAVRRGAVLPACLFGACAANIIAGQFSQATIVGFTMLTAGLCLAAVEQTPRARELDLTAPGVRAVPA